MARGYPDFSSWAGRAGGGEQVLPYSFIINIGAGITANIDLPAVGAGTENTYQFLIISSPDDTAIHDVSLNIPAIPWDWLLYSFVTGAIIDFPGHVLGAGTVVRISISNNAAVPLQFVGAIFWTRRHI